MSFDKSVLTPRTPTQIVTAAPANPTGTTSLTQVMSGLAVYFTPRITGRVQVTVQLQGGNNTLADGALAQVRHGTGTAPTNGAAATGTADGKSQQNISPAAANILPINLDVEIEGLVLGTTYWFDLGQAAITGGTATLTNILIVIVEF